MWLLMIRIYPQLPQTLLSRGTFPSPLLFKLLVKSGLFSAIKMVIPSFGGLISCDFRHVSFIALDHIKSMVSEHSPSHEF